MNETKALVGWVAVMLLWGCGGDDPPAASPMRSQVESRIETLDTCLRSRCGGPRWDAAGHTCRIDDSLPSAFGACGDFECESGASEVAVLGQSQNPEDQEIAATFRRMCDLERPLVMAAVHWNRARLGGGGCSDARDALAEITGAGGDDPRVSVVRRGVGAACP